MLSFTLVVASVPLFQNTKAYADYTVAAGQKCQDNSNPVQSDSNGKLVYTCTGTQNPAGATPTTQTTGSGASSSGDNVTTCAIEKLGWILCPLIQTAGKVGDQAFEFLAKNFLETEPELIANDSGTKTAWELARNIANLMFIIVFLLVILSQVTGRGLDNYGIKKLLPRLIVAAIAVNVSYYICQLMVDLSNVMGYEIENFLVNTAGTVSDRSALPPQTSIDIQTSDGTLGTIALWVLGAAGVVWFLLPVLGMGISIVVITCAVIIAILLMRKAFIVLLVVASPVAFVMYLLPNTEKLFQKWLKMFWQLLMVFPIIGALFGGGQLASAIVLVAGSHGETDSSAQVKSIYSDGSGKCIQLPSSKPPASTTTDTNGNPIPGKPEAATIGTCGAKSTPFMLGLVAAGIAVAPMIAVWAVLKGALSAAGAIGGKISGAIQNAGDKAGKRAKAAEDDMRKRAGMRANSAALNGKFGRGVAGAAGIKEKRRLKNEELESRLKAAQAGFAATNPGANKIATQDLRNKLAAQAAQSKLSSDFSSDIARGRINVADSLGVNGGAMTGELQAQKIKAEADAMKDIQLSADIAPGDIGKMGTEMEKAVASGDSLRARAFQSMLLSSGSKGLNQFHSSMGNMQGSGIMTAGSSMESDLRQNILSNHGGMKDIDASIDDFATQGGSLADRANGTLGNSWGGLSAAKFVGLSTQAQVKAAKSGQLQAETISVLQDKALQYNGQINPDALTNLKSRYTGF